MNIFKGLSCTMYLMDLHLHYQFYATNQLEASLWFFRWAGRPEETLVHSSDNFSTQSMHVLYKKNEFLHYVFSITIPSHRSSLVIFGCFFGCIFIGFLCSDWFHYNCFSNKHSLCLFSVPKPKGFTKIISSSQRKC